MAGKPQKLLKNQRKSWKTKILNIYNTYCNKEFVYKFFTDPNYIFYIGWILVVIEVFLNIYIIERVKYTEIDWKAYMQQCEIFLNGTLDYTKLKGDTGPAVYPAGYLYIYSLLYLLTSNGKNIHLGQYIFLVIYILQLVFTFRIYEKTKKVPPYTLVLMSLTSYRIHSIYVLRLFNDPIAMLLFYISLNLFLSGKWGIGSVFYSLAVSVKMNILLFAPALLAAYLIILGLRKTILQLFICASIQVILASPFLFVNFLGYLQRSFDLGRIFEHKWTVNYRFLDKNMFENRYFHIGLLILHVLLLVIFVPLIKRYLSSYSKLKMVEEQLKPQLDNKTSAKKVKTKSKKHKQAHANHEIEDETLTKEQEQFLKAFESGLKSQGHKKIDEPLHDEPQEPTYTVNFDSLSQLFVLPFFIVNFIGITCARSLHYQFYTWYFHSLLYLVYCTGYQKSMMFLILAVIELCWNTYPSTIFSSGALHFCHLLILFGVYRTMKK